MLTDGRATRSLMMNDDDEFSAELLRLLRGPVAPICEVQDLMETFNLCAIFVVICHVSLAYIPTDITIALYNHIFVSVLITDVDHIDRMRWNTEGALPILQLTSASASPSHARILPRCVKRSTSSTFWPPTVMGCSTSTSPTCLSFVLLALTRSPTFPASISRFVVMSCKVAYLLFLLADNMLPAKSIAVNGD